MAVGVQLVFVSLAQVDISFVGLEVVNLRRSRFAVFVQFDMYTVEDAADSSSVDLDIEGSLAPQSEVLTGLFHYERPVAGQKFTHQLRSFRRRARIVRFIP